MSAQLLQGFLDAHRDDIGQIFDQTYSSMASAVESSYTSGMNYNLIFEGLTASRNAQGEFQLNVGEMAYEIIPKAARLVDLEREALEAAQQVISFKEKNDDIISHAGDIEQTKIEGLQIIIEMLVRNQVMHETASRGGMRFGKLGELALKNGFSISADFGRESSQETEQGLVKSFGKFSVSMRRMTEEEIPKKIEIEFYRHLLKLYQHFFREQAEDKGIVKFSLQPHAKGIPLVHKCAEFVMKGFMKSESGTQIIEEMRIEYSNGCIFVGRKVNGTNFGTGSFRMTSGGIFKGKIAENMIAEGVIIDGIREQRGKFRVVVNDTTHSYVSFGEIQIFQRNKLVQQGMSLEDGSFKGWILEGSRKHIGEWDTTGRFIRGKIESPEIFLEGSFSKDGLEGQGRVVKGNLSHQGLFRSGKPHGKGTQLSGKQRIEGQWHDGNLISGTITEGDVWYQGQFNSGKPNGRGVLRSNGTETSGEFLNGLPHGNCTHKSGQVTFVGNFSYGKPNGHGTMTAPNFTYVGNFVNGKKHGKGEFRFSNCTYTGDVVNDEIRGQGKWVQSDFTYEGSFSDGKFNGYGKVIKQNGVSFSGFFKDGQKVQ